MLAAAMGLLMAGTANAQTKPAPKKPAAPAGATAAAGAGAAAQKKPQMAEDVFKDVKILKGMSVNEFMDTMGFMAASLSYNCTDCHNVDNFAEPSAGKTTARKMLLMMNAINKDNFGGARNVTCYTCHNDAPRPKQTPSLAQQYATTFLEDPNEVVIPVKSEGGPTADQILDKYIAALGGADKLASVTSLVAKGTYVGYDTTNLKRPIDLYAKAPNERSMLIHDPLGDIVWTADGHNAWVASPANVVLVSTLTGGDLDAALLDASLFFPGKIKQSFSQWRAGATNLDDKEVAVVQGNNPGKTPVKFYFDKTTGLLLRTVRYTPTVIGLVVSQVDYSDYRPVNGVQMPFKYLYTWTDGQSTVELSDVQVNAPVDASKFTKPATPVKR
jgi:photosynthetic reaction center cytochrome c subunit